MISRKEILSRAIKECLQEIYKYVQPHIEWDEFVKESKNYSNKYKAWKRYYELSKKESLTKEELKEFSVYPNEWKDKSLEYCIGPHPYDFYYLPKDVFKEIVDSFINAYELDHHQQLLDIIYILKDYCEKPIVDKYIEKEDDEPYDHPACLKARIEEFLEEHYDLYDPEYNSEDSQEIIDMFFEFLDMAGNFYKWNAELDTFETSVYLGPSPNTNKQDVIDNWKKYRNQIIEINDSEYDNEE
jgi:hypothetical protein